MRIILALFQNEQVGYSPPLVGGAKGRGIHELLPLNIELLRYIVNLGFTKK